MYTLRAAVEFGGQEYLCSDYENEYFCLTVKETAGTLQAVLHAKKDLYMRSLTLTADRNYAYDDLFFVNGWQSWSLSKECKKDSVMNGITHYARLFRPSAKAIATNGDYLFTTYGKTGLFHSWSYTYFRKEGSRFIDLYGSRSERNGFTMFEADMNAGTFTIGKDIDGLELLEGQDFTVFDICHIEDEYNRAFNSYFFGFMGLKVPRLDRLTGYSSWHHYQTDISEKKLMGDLDGLKNTGDDSRVFLVDNGYQSIVGDWIVPNPKKFPDGLRPIVEAAHQQGNKAGIWLAPFCAHLASKTARAHPDWILRDSRIGKRFLADYRGGGVCALDIYNPEVQDYLKEVFRTVFEDWGFDMVKLDYLYVACIQPRLGKTRGQLMCEAVDFLRELCGNKLILGSGVPLGACWGIFDACRIIPSISASYNGSFLTRLEVNNEVPSTRNNMVNTVFRRGLNGRAFINDPDAFSFRESGLDYSLPQKMLVAKVFDICGGVMAISDNAAEYDDRAERYVRYFFRDRGCSPEFAEQEDQDRMKIIFREEGVEKTLRLNLKTGYSNVVECM